MLSGVSERRVRAVCEKVLINQRRNLICYYFVQNFAETLNEKRFSLVKL